MKMIFTFLSTARHNCRCKCSTTWFVGQFAGGTFLFSSGFWLSGYTDNYLWANGVASASLVEDYIAGTVGMDPNDPKASIYKLSSEDVPFGQSWQDWIDAVNLGADFYDGNGDGIYNPVDLTETTNGIRMKTNRI